MDYTNINKNSNDDNNSFQIRFAVESDIPTIIGFIKELAEYENMLDDVIADEDILREWVFDKKKAEALIGEYNGASVGYVLFFHNFSTFLGRAGIYLEDIYIKPNYRGLGFGRMMLQRLASIAVERGCGRMEWNCLDWDEPGVQFNLSLDAEPLEGWTVYRLTGEALRKLATSNDQ